MADDPATWLKDFAARVLQSEKNGERGGDAGSNFSACEKLRNPLAKMLGVSGFQSLLARAVALAGAKTPWLRTLRTNSNGLLEGLGEVTPPPDPQTVAEGEALILGELLGLLITFIGPSLTLGLAQETWPELEIWKV